MQLFTLLDDRIEVHRFGMVEGIGAALRVGMELKGNVVEVEVGGTVIIRSVETAALVVSLVILEAF